MMRDEWLAKRKLGIGASDCAAVLGIDPYRGPIAVYNEKLGIEPPFKDSEAIKWGRRLEPFVAEEFAADHPEWLVVKPGDFHMQFHPDLPFIFCTPDRWLDPVDRADPRGPSDPAGLQIKTVGTYAVKYWPSDNMPDQYLCQCIHEMACHPWRDVWFLRALVGGQSDREYFISRDRDLEAEIMRRLSEFWHHNVLAKIPPPMDATTASDRLLKHLYPNAGQFIRQADSSEIPFLEDVVAAKEAADTAVERYQTLANSVKEKIGTDKGIEWDRGLITWSTVKGRTTIDYKAVLDAANVPQHIIDTHTKTGMPTRMFRVISKGEE